MSDLRKFIEFARERKISDGMIRHLLISNGWKDREVCAEFAAVVLDVPIPEIRDQGGSRETFFHLSAFACLYVSVTAFLVLLFNLIDLSLPDSTQNSWEGQAAKTTIRSSVSALVVFFPLYSLFTWLIRKEIKSAKMVAGGAVERWLTFMTLFLIVMTTLIDVSTLLFWLLEGEITSRFLLKASLLLAVMLGVFFYIWRGTKKWSLIPQTKPVAGKA